MDPSHADPATSAADRGQRARAAYTAALLAWADGKRAQLPQALLQRLKPEQQQQLKERVERLVAAMKEVGSVCWGREGPEGLGMWLGGSSALLLLSMLYRAVGPTGQTHVTHASQSPAY